jgi:TRAP transporter 4TM/12TM fusion protein
MDDTKVVTGSNCIVRAIAIMFVLFQLYTAGFGQLPLLEQRAIHVCFAVVLILLTIPALDKKRSTRIPIWDVMLVIAFIISVVNIVIKGNDYLTYMGDFKTYELVLAIISVLVLMETARRTQGNVFPIITLFMMVYALAGPYFPGKWGHLGLSITTLMRTLYQGDLGMWGYITGISASTIAVFLIFGTFMEFTKGGETFIMLGSLIAGRLRGGPALVSVISSALFGMISGSAVANVATTGNLTIPAMKHAGYKPEFAGAVESVASMGGQFTPPIMGATAFIMAEFLNISYLTICLAAIIPAILFYLSLFVSILCQAGKRNLLPIPKEQIPKVRDVVTWQRLGPLIGPVAVLIYFVAVGFTLWRAVFWAVITATVIYLLLDLSWNNIKGRLSDIVHALEKSAFTIAKLVPILVCANMVVSLLGQTGFGIKLSGAIVSLSENNIMASLVLACLLTIILGMGMPTSAAYIIGVAIAGTSLIKVGLNPLAVHMFVQYFGCVSSITPPVCITIFTASGIAGVGWKKIVPIALKLSVVVYIIPFIFMYEPEMLGRGILSVVFLKLILNIVAVSFISIGIIGWFLQPLGTAVKFALVAAGVILLIPPISPFYSIPLFGAGLVMQWLYWLNQKREKEVNYNR